MTTFDPHLLDQLARCYADAVVRRLLEGREEAPDEPVVSAPSVAPGTPTGSQMSSEEESAEILACCFYLLQQGKQT